MHLHPVHAVEDPSTLAKPPDLVIIAVKSYDTPEAIRQIRPVVDPNTQILTIQNGLENYELLSEEFGGSNVIRGLCKIGVELTVPGVIDYRGLSSVIFGEEDGTSTNRVLQLQKIMEHAGITVKVSHDIRRDAWIKFIWNGIFNMLTGLGGATTDRIFEDEDAYGIAWQLFYEMQAVAEAQGFVSPTRTEPQ
jgi:2-dehydropantoate 2-reductase